MNAYIFHAAFLCEDCAAKVKAQTPLPEGADPSNEATWDSDDYPKGPFLHGGGESDGPEHCAHCSTFLENPLTEHGEAYVRVAVNEKVGDQKVLAEWKSFYDYLFD
jgi:hypothetical protein